MLHVAALHDADQIAEFVLDKGDIPFDLKDKVTCLTYATKLPHTLTVWRNCTSHSLQEGELQSAGVVNIGRC